MIIDGCVVWLQSKALHGDYNNLSEGQMSKSRPKKSKSSPIPIFISKLLEIVENEELGEIVSWTSTRDSFNIKNITRFTEEVLPRYFKHHNFASFIRQLNMYGFKKIRHPEGDNVYMNEHFQQGNPPLLANIHRKMRDDRDDEVVLYSQPQTTDNTRAGREIQELRNKQKNLEDMCKRFLQQNQKLLEQNQTLMKKMEKESREKQRRLQEFLLYLLAQKNSRAINGSEAPQLTLNADPEALPFPTSDATPLEVIGSTMDQDEGFRKMRTMLQSAYNNRIPRRRERNYTIVGQREQQQAHGESLLNPHDESSLLSDFPLGHPSKEQDNKSFLSINDFINAEDDQDFNLQESN